MYEHDINFNIISIDPGTNFGVAVYTISSIDFTIQDIKTYYLGLDKYLDSIDTDSKLLEKAEHIVKFCTYLYNEYNPVAVISESAFGNIRFPRAGIQLSYLISSLELTFTRCNPMIKLYRYPPKYVKRYIGAGGNAGKPEMLATVGCNKEIIQYIDVNGITEHEIDALAIGYVALVSFREYPHLLYVY